MVLYSIYYILLGVLFILTISEIDHIKQFYCVNVYLDTTIETYKFKQTIQYKLIYIFVILTWPIWLHMMFLNNKTGKLSNWY